MAEGRMEILVRAESIFLSGSRPPGRDVARRGFVMGEVHRSAGRIRFL